MCSVTLRGHPSWKRYHPVIEQEQSKGKSTLQSGESTTQQRGEDTGNQQHLPRGLIKLDDCADALPRFILGPRAGVLQLQLITCRSGILVGVSHTHPAKCDGTLAKWYHHDRTKMAS